MPRDQLNIRVTEGQLTRWKNHAEAQGQTLSTWIRRTLNKEMQGDWPDHLGPEPCLHEKTVKSATGLLNRCAHCRIVVP